MTDAPRTSALRHFFLLHFAGRTDITPLLEEVHRGIPKLRGTSARSGPGGSGKVTGRVTMSVKDEQAYN